MGLRSSLYLTPYPIESNTCWWLSVWRKNKLFVHRNMRQSIIENNVTSRLESSANGLTWCASVVCFILIILFSTILIIWEIVSIPADPMKWPLVYLEVLPDSRQVRAADPGLLPDDGPVDGHSQLVDPLEQGGTEVHPPCHAMSCHVVPSTLHLQVCVEEVRLQGPESGLASV